MRKHTSKIFMILGLVSCLIALFLAFGNLHRSPVLLDAPKEAAGRVEALMHSLCDGDYDRAQSLFYGDPDLGLDDHVENVVAQVIRPVYKKSLSYSVRHDPYITEGGLAVCVDVRSLDVAAMTELVAQNMLTMDLEPEAVDALGSWAAALAAIPPESYPYLERTITLNLVNDQGLWWILPENAILNVISGITE